MADLPPALRSLLGLASPAVAAVSEPAPATAAALPPTPGEEALLSALLAEPASVPPELAEILERAERDRLYAAILRAYEPVRNGMRQGYADGDMQRFLAALDAGRGKP